MSASVYPNWGVWQEVLHLHEQGGAGHHEEQPDEHPHGDAEYYKGNKGFAFLFIFVWLDDIFLEW